jgi:serine protease Do
VRLKVFRNGQEREVSVTLGELPSKPSGSNQGSEQKSALDGVSVDELTPPVARQLGLPASTRGVVVVDVESESAADDAGLQRGDVIQEVNHKPITNVSDFERAVDQAGNSSVLLLVNRGGNTFYVVVEPQ